ncbi:MAG TPA: 30S ribosomal protein S4 [Candidatus Moranbacteria bacterium]|nr:MAG: 30S ribosomal protein S4 [Candidatus Moranbacteria bacterium GW2011_GWC2_45_10]KKT95531.1 MAG: ribosomal protein S4, small subunit ribosomal protein S4 [Parcubacteria group bacterium GW2011_GWC1_45_14]HAV11061.1 30S ribosomal protein S4 [Candidatus Moranbacteria bacterium]
MARDLDSKCKKCRRAGEKLFLKGDRCNSAKCAVVRRPYAPGQHGKNISRGLSEFGKQLAMKQRIKRMYGVLEKQFRRHFDEAKGKKGVTGDMLMARLELRLDSVVRKMGFSQAPAQARQLVTHGHFTVNGKKVDIPSFEVKIGDVIGINETKKDGAFFASQLPIVKNKKDFPSWMQFDTAKFEGKVISLPTRDEIDVHVDPQMIVEYYSR